MRALVVLLSLGLTGCLTRTHVGEELQGDAASGFDAGVPDAASTDDADATPLLDPVIAEFEQSLVGRFRMDVGFGVLLFEFFDDNTNLFTCEGCGQVGRGRYFVTDRTGPDGPFWCTLYESLEPDAEVLLYFERMRRLDDQRFELEVLAPGTLSRRAVLERVP
jgi:hypothetical protein